MFRTHQGVKGNEFDHFMVIMDDDETDGFLFSYELYFGAKALSNASEKRRNAGEEIALDRTRRLVYVTSTRMKVNLIERTFAKENEIIEIKK